jgi:hypothetical protein
MRTAEPLLDDLDAKILAALDKFPLESDRSIAETLHAAYSTTLVHLHDSVGFRSFHLSWVPHLLTRDLRQKRGEYAKTILPFLHASERDR